MAHLSGPLEEWITREKRSRLVKPQHQSLVDKEDCPGLKHDEG
jgi:hypothetical protein